MGRAEEEPHKVVVESNLMNVVVEELFVVANGKLCHGGILLRTKEVLD